MKTAKEVYNESTMNLISLGTPYSVTSLMVKFAKMHVEAALEAAAENGKLKQVLGQGYYNKVVIDKDSILQAYDLDQIK